MRIPLSSRVIANYSNVAPSMISNPLGVMIGGGVGGVLGLLRGDTDDTGIIKRGINTLAFGALGAGLGLAGGSLYGNILAQGVETSSAIRFLNKLPSDFASNPRAREQYLRSIRNSSNLSQATKSRIVQGITGTEFMTPESHFMRKTKSVDQIRSGVWRNIADLVGLDSNTPINSAALQQVGEVPYWLRTAMVAAEYEASTSTVPTGPFRRGGTITDVNQAAANFNDWAKIENAINQGDETFLRALSKKSKEFGESKLQGMLGVESIALSSPLETRQSRVFAGVGGRNVAMQLRKQGAAYGEIADLVSDLEAQGIGIKAYKNLAQGSGRITELELLNVPGSNKPLKIPILTSKGEAVVGPTGVFQARKLIFHDDLAKAASALQAGNVKQLTRTRADVWALKTLADRISSAKDIGIAGELVEYVQEHLEKATTWEDVAFRPSRQGLSSTGITSDLRRGSVIIGAPSAKLSEFLGLDELFEQGRYRGSAVHNLARKVGLIQLGSESSATKGVFTEQRVAQRYSVAVGESPVDKPSAILRDFGKQYYVAGKPEGPQQAQRLFFGTKAFGAKMGANQPLAGQLIGILPQEQEVLQDLNFLLESKGYTPKSALLRNLSTKERNKLISGLTRAAGGKDAARRVFFAMSSINEGIIAAGIDPGYKMASRRTAYVSGLDLKTLLGDEANELQKLASQGKLKESLLQKKLIGRELSPDSALGFKMSGRSMQRGSMRTAGAAGTMKITGLKIVDQGFALEIEELLDARYAKFGSMHGKYHNMPIDPSDVGRGIAVLRALRTNKQFARLVGNEAYVHIPSTGDLSNRYFTGFAMMDQLVKGQGLATQVPIETIMGKYYRDMSLSGQRKVQKILSAGLGNRLTFKNGGVLLQGAEVAGVHDTLRANIRNLVTELMQTPENFFESSQGLTGMALWRKRGLITTKDLTKITDPDTLMSYFLSMGTVTAHQPWDSPVHNVAKSAGIDIHQLKFLNRMGLGKTAEHMMGRRGAIGLAESTKEFFNARIMQAEGRAISSNIPIKGLEDISDISGYSLATNQPISPTMQSRHWRRSGKYKDTFIIDLMSAEKTQQVANEQLRKVMGRTQLIIPGTSSDLWQDMYVTGDTLASPEKFGRSLESLTRRISQFRESVDPLTGEGDEILLRDIERLHSQYERQLSQRIGVIATGRGGALQDTGPFASGKVTYRGYHKKYGSLVSEALGVSEKAGTDIAGRMVGVGTQEWRRLVEQARRSGMAPQVFRGRTSKVRYLPGISIRQPISDVGPVFIIHDPTLNKLVADGTTMMAVDEVDRGRRAMDWDGDRMVAHVVTDAGSAAELRGALIDSLKKNLSELGPEQLLYREFLAQGSLLGGVREEIRYRAELGEPLTPVERMQERLGKMRMLKDRDTAEFITKYYTQHIGRYSNLSKELEAIAHSIENQDIGDRVMRGLLADELQQMAIDFSRHGTAGTIDPSIMASRIQGAQMTAIQGDIELANQEMRKLFEELGVIDSINERMAQAESGAVRITGLRQEDILAYRARFDRITSGYFSGIDPKRAAISFAAVQASLEKPELTMRGLTGVQSTIESDRYIRNLARGGAEGILPGAPGRTPASADEIARINRAIKSAGEGVRGFKRAFTEMMSSPTGRAGMAVAGTALAGMAVIGALTPAMPLHHESEAHKAMQRTPDTAMAGADGYAPIPGSRYGNVAPQGRTQYIDKYSQAEMPVPKRFYYEQSNRVPNITTVDRGPINQAVLRRNKIAEGIQTAMAPGGNVNSNIAYSPTARRLSQQEIQDRLREEMLG